MLSKILTVLSGDSIAKVLNIGISLYLIDAMSVEQYSYFALMFTAIMMSYQMTCGVFERLYIADHRDYVKAFYFNFLNIAVPVGLISGSYILYLLGREAGVLFGLGYVAFILFQSIRICAQKEENFKLFALLDILKSVSWAIITALLVFLGFSEANHFLMALIVSALLASLPIVDRDSRLKRSSGELRLITGFEESVIYLRKKAHILTYSILAGCMPYVPIIVAGLICADETIAAYGVAIRYQAIFSLIIYAVNAVLLPKFSKLSSDPGNVTYITKEFYKKMPLALFFLSVSAVFIVFVMPLLGADKYETAQISFLVLAFSSACSLASTPAAIFLLASKKFREMLYSILYGMVGIFVCVPFLFVLDKEYGVIVSSAIGYAVCSVSMINFMKKNYEYTNR